MTVPTSPASILSYLKKHKMDVTLQEETNQVVLEYRSLNKNYPLFIRAVGQGALVQCALIIKNDFKESQINEIARLLHSLNKDLDFPGFCMEEEQKVLFYRAVLPTPDKRIKGSLLRQVLHMIEQVITMFAPMIEKVSTTDITFKEVNAQFRKK